jgi:hypothetical protein
MEHMYIIVTNPQLFKILKNVHNLNISPQLQLWSV